MNISIRSVSGSRVRPYLPALARLRITVFREFPYLYEGSEDYERRYLQKYVNSERSIMVLTEQGGEVVGASSGLPLADEAEEMQRPFVQAGYDLSRIFYCGESVLLSEYRGRGLGGRFFAEREAHARALGGFHTMAFCAVERPEDHPLRPHSYTPLDAFWQRRGYRCHPELVTHYRWQDIDQPAETDKPMVFWLKAL